LNVASLVSTRSQKLKV